MADPKTVACRAPGCTMRDKVVTTAITNCLSCGAELKPALDFSDLLDGFFGGP